MIPSTRYYIPVSAILHNRYSSITIKEQRLMSGNYSYRFLRFGVTLGRSQVYTTSRSATAARRSVLPGTRENSTFGHPTLPMALPVKAGTPIKGLDFFKDKEQAVVLERCEYPEFVDRLANPLPSLARLRRMPIEEADDKLMRRYLKLKRRIVIKENNRSREK